MKIFIIGNGFDLNLGLPTTYKDFMSDSLFTSELKKDNKLAIYLKTVELKNNWVDIENELAKVSKRQGIPNFEEEYYSIVSKLLKYIGSIDIVGMRLDSWANNLFNSIGGEQFRVINFNYSDSVKYILNKRGIRESDMASNLIHIHGSIEEKEIIFGVQDNAHIPPDKIFIKKSYSKVLKSISVHQELKRASEINFFGHSLGVTDHSYFSGFFNNLVAMTSPSRKKINFYHYGDSGYRDLMIQLDVLTGKRIGSLRQKHEINFIDVSKPVDK